MSATNRGERGGEGTIADVLAGRAQWVVVEGDCLQVLPMLPEGLVDHIIADPPYSEHTHAKQWTAAALTDRGERRHTDHDGLDFEALTVDVARMVAAEAARIAARWVALFTDLEGIGGWREAVVGAGLDYVRSCIWVKPDATPQFTGERPASGAEAFVLAHQPGRKRWNGGGKRNVYAHCRAAGGSDHPTTKPETLMLEIVEDFTDPDEVVLDPFAGSGTTGVACLRLGRRVILIEKSERYANLARERMRAEAQGLTLRDARAGQLPLLAL